LNLRGRFTIPNWKDPRWSLLLFLLTYALLAVNSPTFTRTPEQFMTAVATCVGLDLLLLLFYKHLKLTPLSGLISAMGTFLLTDSPFVWPYFAVAALSILSKHFITANGRHVFNPNNFGVVVMILFFSDTIMSEAGRWGGNAWQAALIFLFGAFCVVRAKRWAVSFSYLATFGLGVLVRHWLLGAPLVLLSAPMTGAGFHLFMFYMISDPATTPSKIKGQVIFGASLAVLDTYLRYSQFKYAPFVAAFVICAIYSAFRHSRSSSVRAVAAS
jgi:Na+-translocating ferredoxin:NAD+ oxidoreductase RnfD subunit